MDSFTPPAWPPYIHFRDWPVPPPPLAYIREDDYLAVTVLTSSTTTGLALRYRILQAAGGVIDGAETLDGAQADTLRTTIYPLTEGFLLSATVSNIGGGLADSICGVILALQKGGQASCPPHTILAQGFVSNIVGVTWPVGLPRGPATSSSGSLWPQLNLSPDRPPASPNAKDDEFDAVSLDAKWTWVNQGSATASLSKSWLAIALPPTGATSTHSMTGIFQALPAGTPTITAKIGPAVAQNAANIGTTRAHLALRESGTGKITTFGLTGYGDVRGMPAFGVTNWTNETTSASQALIENVITGAFAYVRINYDGTNVAYSYSPNGVTFVQVFTQVKTTPFTVGPNQIGLMGEFCAGAGGDAALCCDFFRVT